MIVTGERVVDYVSAALGEHFEPPHNAIGEARGGRIVSGLLFNNWSRTSVNLSVACEPIGLSRALLRFAARYVWGERGVSRVTIETESGHVIELALRLGGALEGILRDRYGLGRDGALIGIRRADWPRGLE